MLLEALLELGAFAIAVFVMPAALLAAWHLACIARDRQNSGRAFLIPRAPRARARTLRFKIQTLLQLLFHESARPVTQVTHGHNRIAKS